MLGFAGGIPKFGGPCTFEPHANIDKLGQLSANDGRSSPLKNFHWSFSAIGLHPMVPLDKAHLYDQTRLLKLVTLGALVGQRIFYCLKTVDLRHFEVTFTCFFYCPQSVP